MTVLASINQHERTDEGRGRGVHLVCGKEHIDAPLACRKIKEMLKMEFVYLVKIYDSTGRLLPVVTAFATRQGAEAYVHDFLPTGKYQDGAAACKAEIVKTEVRK